ncbi:sphingosine kinase 1-like [Convolutriloba macropyga]|uniref:sphingosine kinase 1-like n=1 Tax=Convolutriloba macropyga TaxID=536237 RepID=UPI003F51D45D
MSVSTTTTEWFQAPHIDSQGQKFYVPLDRDILQLPIIVTLDCCLELINLTDDQARDGNYSEQENVAKVSRENRQYEDGAAQVEAQRAEVRLTHEGVLALKPNTSPSFISAPVLTGCVINSFPNYSIISIYFYILIRRGNNRVERVTRYHYPMGPLENKQALNKFYKAIQLVIRGADLGTIRNIETIQWQPEKVLVLLNPRSGKGQSMKVYQTIVTPMLRQACMEAKLVVTSYKNHASDYALRERLDIYSSILLVSGDGLYHEFLSGLMERKDRQDAGRVPVSIIPTGSNNTLAGSILRYRGEHTKKKHAAVNCMFAFIKGHLQACDIVQIRSSNLVYYSGLYYMWGNLAQIYDNSKKLTFLGNYRLLPWILIKLIRNKGTYGRLWYRHASAEPNSELMELPNTCFSVFLICNVSNITYSVTAHRDVDPGCGFAVLCYVKYPISRSKLWNLLNQVRNGGNHVDTHEFQTIPIQYCVFEPTKRDTGIALCDGEALPQSNIELGVLPKFAWLKF